jgi:hypothetical protein
MSMRYRRPTPLLDTLGFSVARATTGGRTSSHAAIHLGERVLCEADVESVAGHRADLPEVSPRRVPR